MRLILIQGNYMATYIRNMQVGVFECDSPPNKDDIEELWNDGSSWK